MGKVFVQEAPAEDNYALDLALLGVLVVVFLMAVRSKFKRH